MKLNKLLNALDEYELTGSSDVEIAGISYTSQKVKRGDLFAALPGHNMHGIQFVSEARKRGAAAVLTDLPMTVTWPVVRVPDARRALALLSNRFYDDPSAKLKLVGVTGTNGKTTVSFLVRSIFESANISCGIIGTIRYSGEQFSMRSVMTTPESVDLQELLIQFLNEGSGACSIEVSSQGLDQHRVTGCTFAAAIFTNLTQDHLDYHKTMEQYFQAKRMLFDPKVCDTRLAVINRDDPYGERILASCQSVKRPAVSYGFDKESDYQVTFWKSTLSGTDIVIRHGSEDEKIRTPLIGKYNVYNVAGAYAAATEMGIGRASVLEGIERLTGIPGRMQKLEWEQPFDIILDYAHSEDAFRQLLPTLRAYTKGRIIHIFGCRGKRDQSKRPLMGQAAGELADVIILTSDNPADEDPQKIAQDIKAGIDRTGNANVYVVIDRAEAIAHSVAMAKAGDTIVITGKGNETYQLINDQKFDSDDREHFRAALQGTTRNI